MKRSTSAVTSAVTVSVARQRFDLADRGRGLEAGAQAGLACPFADGRDRAECRPIALARLVLLAERRLKASECELAQPELAWLTDRLRDRQRAAQCLIRLVPDPAHRRALALDAPGPALVFLRCRRHRAREALVGPPSRAVGVTAQERQLSETGVAVHRVAPRHPLRRRRMAPGRVGF